MSTREPHQIRVHLIEARGLKGKSGESDLVNPVAKISLDAGNVQRPAVGCKLWPLCLDAHTHDGGPRQETELHEPPTRHRGRVKCCALAGSNTHAATRT